MAQTPQPIEQQGLNGVKAIATKFGKEFVGFAASRIGGRSENQDTCAFTDTPMGLLVLVCDGMGGGPGGKTASMIAAKVICDDIAGITTAKEPEIALRDAINHANEAIQDYAAHNVQLRGMGSTVAALLINKDYAVASHIGDSRIYQFRGHSIVYRSTDHSKVMELVKAHVINEEQARTSGESNIITQALGHGREMHPETVRLPYERGDRFALCSDGIWGVFPQKEITAMLTSTKSPAGAVDSTVIKVDDYGMANGRHHDNLTLAVVDTNISSKLKAPMSKTTKIILCVLGGLLAVSVVANIIQFTGSGTSDTVKDSITLLKNNNKALTDSVSALRERNNALNTENARLQGKAEGAAETAGKVAEANAKAKEQAQVAPESNAQLEARIKNLEAQLAKIKSASDKARPGLVAQACKEMKAIIAGCKNAQAKAELQKGLAELEKEQSWKTAKSTKNAAGFVTNRINEAKKALH